MTTVATAEAGARDRTAEQHLTRGRERAQAGDEPGAIAAYRAALAVDRTAQVARRELTLLLAGLGRLEEGVALWTGPDGDDTPDLDWLDGAIWAAMRDQRFDLAGERASLYAALRWRPGAARTPEQFVTAGKLRHDLEQFRYLRTQAVLGSEYDTVIGTYERLLADLTRSGDPGRVPLNGELGRAVSDVYGRIVHIRDTPRVGRALSAAWDPGQIERAYLDKAPGCVVIDDFLTAEALRELQLFCLESTVWSANRYAHGRLGAFFKDGFNCPLLLQIAEELRDAFPAVIGRRYPIRQLWGFKNGHHLPDGSNTHADFAAVNVNFWITPTAANADPSTGGLLVYGVDAPRDWSFDTYNRRQDVIGDYLRGRDAQPRYIPYRENRAIIFNSDLFHGTAGLTFRPGYENRRVNITMLYGERAEDVHHPHVAAAPPDSAPAATAPAWRSAALGRRRR